MKLSYRINEKVLRFSFTILINLLFGCEALLRGKCPNTEFFLVRILSECGKIQTRKKFCISTRFTQWSTLGCFVNFLVSR